MDSEKAEASGKTKSQIRRRMRRKKPKPADHVRKKDLKSDESVWALYRGWNLYHKMERTPEEMQRRFNIFKNTAIRVREVNKSGLALLCLSRFADREFGEIKHRVVGMSSSGN